MNQRSRIGDAGKLKRQVVLVLVCLFIATTCQLSPASCLHKFHATISQVDYNDKEQGVEIVVRFFADDFETAISQHAKREVKFNTPQSLKNKANTDAVFAYVRERFEVKRKERQCRQTGVGWHGNAVRYGLGLR